MKKHRSTVAIAFVALLAAAGSDANAGKGKLRRGGGSLERTANGVVFREKATHTKGIRSKVTFGLLGKTLGVTNEQSAGGVKSTVKRGRQRATKAVEASGNGTVGRGNYERKNFITRKWKSKMTRTDQVGDNQIVENGAKKRFLGFSKWDVMPTRRTGRMGNSEESINGQRRATSSGGAAYRGKLKGSRRIERTPESMELVDTQSKRWGLLKTVSFGLLGKKKRVAIEQRQTPDGMDVTMTTPRAKMTRKTVVGNGVTMSTGEYSKKGRVRERDETRISETGGVHRTEKLRRDGSVKQIVTERMTNDGRTRVTRKKVRKDGSVSKIKEKESVIGADGKKSWQRSRTTFRKNGSVRTNIGIGKVDGTRRANVKTPIGSLGSTKERITTSSPGPAQTVPRPE